MDLITMSLIFATIVLAVLTVQMPNILYAVLCLCGMSITIGILFAELHAPYVMVFQLLIYAGATVVMFIATIMLVRRGEE